MANPPPPKIDSRTATQITEQVQELLVNYTQGQWQEFEIDPVTQKRKPKGISAALIGVFARYAEIIIQRLNQVPNKNFLAFLDLLGASQLPPQPARVPLTFSLAAGSAVDAIVPAGTQVAAPPAEGEKDPVIFETERELVVTAAQLESVFVRDPEQDQYGDYSTLTRLVEGDVASSLSVSAFRGERAIAHVLYLGHNRLLSFSQIATLRLNFTLTSTSPLQDERELQWEVWNGTQWQEILLTDDQTQTLKQSGQITFNLSQIQAIPTRLVNSSDSRWLRCRLLTPISRTEPSAIYSKEQRLGMVRDSQLPSIKQIQMTLRLSRPVSEGLLPEIAVANAVPIELGQPFFPFGEKPKFNDTLYLANTEAFSKDRYQGLAEAGATIKLEISIANSHLLQTANSVRPSEDLQLAWECWNGSTWQTLGISTAPSWLSLLELDRIPPLLLDSATTQPKMVVVQGTTSPGASVLIEAPSATDSRTSMTPVVGEDGRFAEQVSLAAGVNIIAFTASYGRRSAKAWAVIFRGTQEDSQKIQFTSNLPDSPVQSEQINLSVSVTGSNANLVQFVRVTNGNVPGDTAGTYWQRQVQKGTSISIPLAEGRNALLIEGLDGNARTIAATTLAISRKANTEPTRDRNGFSDGTYGLCQTGIVTLRLPDTVERLAVNGQENNWLRVRLVGGDYGKDATYKLKNPLNPAEGFTLVLATFKPPIISAVKIGYEQTLTGVPEHCLTYNNLEFEDVTLANKEGNPSFTPFRPAPEDKPSLYLGFTLPSNRPIFPNRPLNVFFRTTDVQYGEKLVPLSPTQSQACQKDDTSNSVSHQFWLTNPAPSSVQFQVSLVGTRWASVLKPTSLSSTITLAPGESRQIEVQVAIPANALPGSSDRGFLKLTQSNPPLEYSAEFETFAGTQIPAEARLQIGWQYWNGREWVGLTVRDDSENLTRQGLVEFLPPIDFCTKQDFGLPPRYWLRAVWRQGSYPVAPRLDRILLNTTMAAQTITLRNEVLGSSDGTENQKFRTTRAPVLKGQHLEVRELEMPSAQEQQAIARDEGEDAITPTDTSGRSKDVWVRWHEVSDFYGSGTRDRHYILDHLTGEIQFGDGINGLIPPIGRGNIRIVRYQTGGGAKGNRPARTIVQLKTTVPYVEKVTNVEAAAGGADAESLDSLRDRIPKTLRHRNRAVTSEDYEDLAMLASPDVARAQCVPLRNLNADPLSEQPARPGEVSVIIVPRSLAAKPLPSLELIDRVQEYLETYASPTANISVVGPLYVRVEITVEIALTSREGASAVERAIEQKLTNFLHPLTGGLNGSGWDFGREPHNSDFYALLESIPGVDHIRTLNVAEIEDRPNVKKTNRFLVYSGKHSISLVFEQS